MAMPPNEYFSVTFGAGTLGFSVIGRRPFDYALGDAIVESIQPGPDGHPGQAERGNVIPGDAIVSVNDDYVAFSGHAAVITKIKASPRPVVLQFCRPLTSTWTRIRSAYGAEVYNGVLQMRAGWRGKWKARTVMLTRETLSYFSEGVLKKRFSLSEVTQVCVDASHDKNPSVFEVKVVGSDGLVFMADSHQEKILWMHAIECAKLRAFDKAPSSGSQVPPSSAAPEYSVATNSPSHAAPRVPPRSPGVAKHVNKTAEVGPYWMLQFCKLQISGDGVLSTSDKIDHPNEQNLISEKLGIDYNFEVEKSIVNKARSST